MLRAGARYGATAPEGDMEETRCWLAEGEYRRFLCGGCWVRLRSGHQR
jgi:hypothetical protein